MCCYSSICRWGCPSKEVNSRISQKPAASTSGSLQAPPEVWCWMIGRLTGKPVGPLSFCGAGDLEVMSWNGAWKLQVQSGRPEPEAHGASCWSCHSGMCRPWGANRVGHLPAVAQHGMQMRSSSQNYYNPKHIHDLQDSEKNKTKLMTRGKNIQNTLQNKQFSGKMQFQLNILWGNVDISVGRWENILTFYLDSIPAQVILMFLVLPFSYTNTLWCASQNKEEIKHTKTWCLGSSVIYFGGELDFLGHCRTQRSLLGLSAAPSPCAANSWTAKSWFLSSSGGDNVWDDGRVHKPGLRLVTASFLVMTHRL